MKKIYLSIIISILFISNITNAQDIKISINKLTEETQQLSESPDNLKLVWWIPIEFWKAVFAENKTITSEQVDEILQALEQYTVLVIVNGNIDSFGEITYKSKDKIFDALEIMDTHKKSYFPLQEDVIDKKTLEITSVMKPILSNMLGNIGENMHFFLFQKDDNPMERIIHPTKEEEFMVKLDGEVFHWKLPLPSLVKPKKCPETGELLNGTWNYCPYHGKKLVSQ